MAEGSISSPESASKAKEAPKKLAKKVGKKEVKGFYYHAAEYQRARQKERNGFLRIVSSVAEPFLLHVRAARLRIEAAKQGGWTKASTVLDNDTTKKLLEGKLTDQEKKQFKAKSQTHAVLSTYDVGSKEDQLAARSMLTTIFEKKGNISTADRALFEKEIDPDDLNKLLKTAQENAGSYTSVDEIKSKFSDDVIFGGLTQQQQDQARQLFLAAIINTGMTIVSYAKYPIIVGLLASNPAGWAIAAGGGLLSAGTRASRLLVEGNTFDISKSKGVDLSGTTHGLLGKIFSVDWEKDPSTRNIQILRAAAAGGIMSFAAKQFAPEILQAWQHPTEIFHPTAGATDSFAPSTAANYIQSHGGALPKGDYYGTGIHAHDVYGPGNQLLLKNVQYDAVTNKLTADIPSATTANMLSENASLPGTDTLHQHFQETITNTNVHYLPDTAHHDWQQLHTFVEHDSQNNTYLELKYNGVDDGLIHDQHYIDVMLGGDKHVFIQNDAVLAINGDHAGDQIQMFQLVNGQVQPVGTISSFNLANELGLTQGKIDNFATLTAKALGTHGTNGVWHGTQDASDLQYILQQRGLYNNGSNGEFLWGYRLGGGYFKDGQFYVGASNHYFSQGVLNNEFVPKEFPGLQIPGEADEHFNSLVGHQPLGGLAGVDNLEDRGLEWLRENVFRDNIIEGLDNATDFGLFNMDNLALWMQDHIPQVLENPWIVYPILSTPYIASGVAGYFYGKNRAQKAGGPLSTKTAGVVVEVALLAALPGAAVTAGLGFLIGKLTNRNGKKTEKPPKPTAPIVPPGNDNPPPGNGAPNPPVSTIPGVPPGPSQPIQPVLPPTNGQPVEPIQPIPAPPAPPPVTSPQPTGTPPKQPNPEAPTVATVLPISVPVIGDVLNSIGQMPALQGIEGLIQNVAGNGFVALQQLGSNIADPTKLAALIDAVYHPLANQLGIDYKESDVPQLVAIVQGKGSPQENLSFLIRFGSILRQVSTSENAQTIRTWLGNAKKTISNIGTTQEGVTLTTDGAVGQIAGDAGAIDAGLGTFLGEIVESGAAEEVATILPELLPILLV